MRYLYFNLFFCLYSDIKLGQGISPLLLSSDVGLGGMLEVLFGHRHRGDNSVAQDPVLEFPHNIGTMYLHHSELHLYQGLLSLLLWTFMILCLCRFPRSIYNSSTRTGCCHVNRRNFISEPNRIQFNTSPIKQQSKKIKSINFTVY